MDFYNFWEPLGPPRTPKGSQKTFQNDTKYMSKNGAENQDPPRTAPDTPWTPCTPLCPGSWYSIR